MKGAPRWRARHDCVIVDNYEHDAALCSEALRDPKPRQLLGQ